MVTVACQGASADAPAAVRLCEASHALGAIPCTYRDALATGVDTGSGVTLTLPCPNLRDPVEMGGLVGVHVAPMIDGDDVTAVSCAIVP